MNKEDFLSEIDNYDSITEFAEYLFTNYICIHKGKERHYYADVLHAFAEGIPTQWNPLGTGWEDIPLPTKDELKIPYRVTPKNRNKN